MIQDTLSKVVYTADGEQREWDVPFQFNDSKDLHIYLTDDGVRIEEVFQNFEVVENGEKKEVDNPDIDFNKEGNYVIYPTEESGLAPLEAGKQILILRETPNTQEEDSSEIYFKSKDIERGLDKLTMQVQELARDSYRAVKVSHFDTTSPEDFTEALFEAGAKAEEAAARAATSESNASLSEQNAASSASAAQAASATATAAAQFAESLKSDTEEFARRAENSASDASASASQASESAHMASDLLEEVSNSIYNKEQIDEKVTKLEGDIALVEEDVTLIESFIPNTASTSNQLVTKQELLDKETDIREDLNEGVNGLQTQITAQASAIAGKQEKGDYATVSQVNAKQDKLVAGPNITIEGNVISATGGGSGEGVSEAVWGAITGDINAQTDLTNLIDTKTASIAEKQDKLTAGEGITIEGNVISATGGGSGGSTELPDNVYTQDNLIAGENITFSEVLPEGGIDEHTLACWHFEGTINDEVNGTPANQNPDTLITDYAKFGTGSLNAGVTYTSITKDTNAPISFDFWALVPVPGISSYAQFWLEITDPSYGKKWIRVDGIAGSKLTVAIMGGATVTTDFTVPKGEWAHYYGHYIPDTQTTEFFANGVKIYSQQNANYPGVTTFDLTKSGVSRFDEVRISKAIRWTEDFTPPTEPYTLATGPSKKAINAVIPEVELPNTVYTQDNLVAGDNIEIKEVVNPNVIDENCILCMHFDNDNKDYSLYSNLSDSTGLTTEYNSTSKFGAASAYVNAGAIYSPKFVEINNEVTIDFWAHTSLNPNASGAQVNIGNFAFAAFGSFSQPQFYLQINGNSIKWPHNYDVSLIKEGWNHFAGVFSKDENGQIVYRFFVNGKKVLQDTSGQTAYFSNDYDLSFMNFVAGYGIDEFRVTKKAVWLDDFTPPTEAYTKGEGGSKKAISAIIPPVELPDDVYRQSNLLGGKDIEIVPEPVEGGIDEHTLACWHFDGKLEDEVSGATLEGVSSDFLITNTSKFGSGCCDIRYASTIATFNEFDTFAVDFWYKHNSENQVAYVGINSDNYGATTAPTNGYRLIITSTQIGFQHSRYHENNSDGEYVDFPMYSSNTWHHIAVQRVGASILQLFVDGTMLLQKTMDLSLDRSNNVVVYGAYQCFDELRVSHTSRYNGDFTPPTRQYSIAEPTGNYLINFTGEAGGSGKNIGEVYYSQSSLASDNAGALPLFTGETIASANTIYPDFYAWVEKHTELQTTAEEYETALSTYGECPKYVVSDGSLRLPKLANYIKMANTSDGITQSEAGLPNITGSLRTPSTNESSSSGAFKITTPVTGDGLSAISAGSLKWDVFSDFDASRSSEVYGNSDTVTPAHTTLYPWVFAFNASVAASTAQAAEFQEGLSGKADANLGNLTNDGKALIPSLSMPGTKSDALTMGATGATYTAPADGYIFITVNTTGAPAWIGRNQNGNIVHTVWPTKGWQNINFWAPVCKGDFEITYSAVQFLSAKFVYAKGAE